MPAIDRSRTTEARENTYGADVLYRYTFNGRIYHSSRYSPADFSSSDFNAAKTIAARYRPRSSATCYVNPSNPQQAMLNRDVSTRKRPMEVLHGQGEPGVPAVGRAHIIRWWV